MPYTVAVAGKGGTGKTTVASLVVRTLRRQGRGPILAVDADPNANLDVALGLKVQRTVADVIDATRGMRETPNGMPKPMYLEYQLETCLAEGRGVDLLVMGRPEGAGCYCYANHLLRTVLDRLMGRFPVVVMDNEAGMEHLSRRTTRDVDLLLVVSDPTAAGLRAATRIAALVGELDLSVARSALVINRASALPPALEAAVEASGLELAGLVPEDPAIVEAELATSPLVDLPDGAPAVEAVGRVLASLQVPAGVGR